jgi:2-oxoisovalerate dehydrogenase E1 component alpha subunit
VKAVDAASTKHKAISTNLLSDGQACGFPVIPVDAHDAVAMYRVAHESIHKARNGGGPTLIEATIFRRPKRSESAITRSLPPSEALARIENYLAAKGIFSLVWKKSLIEKFERDVDVGIETAQHALSRKRT